MKGDIEWNLIISGVEQYIYKTSLEILETGEPFSALLRY